MNTTKGYRGESCESIATKAVTPIERVEDALREATDLAQQTMSMVATIAGHTGTGGRTADDEVPRPSGIVPALADRADDTVSVIRSAKAELIRLANLLGV